MHPLSRWALVACIALLVAGTVGAITHRNGRHRSIAVPRVTSTTRPVRTTHPATTRPGDGAPGPSTAALVAGLITPTDMGGYYQIEPSTGAAIVDSAPCLAGLQPSPAQDGRAVQGLVGPNLYGVPTIVETVLSYPGSSAASVYRALVRTLSSPACANFGLQFAGSSQLIAIRPATIPPVGDAASVWRGQFTLPDRVEQLQVGLVLHGQTVLNLLYVDTVPSSDPIMGNFQSTLSAAIGKLA